MDLIPRPDQVVAASVNLAHRVLHGGVADLRPMPRTIIDDGVLREVYHYRPLGTVTETGEPVLLVAPLAAPSTCFDLRRGCSLVEHLLGHGRPTYVVEYGEIAFGDPGLALEHWVTTVVPEAVRRVSAHAGDRPVHLVGWSLGGLFALLAAAAGRGLPVASVSVLAAPVDLSLVPPLAPVRPLLGVVDARVPALTLAHRLLGSLPESLVRRAFGLPAVTALVAKPFVQLAKLDDTELLAQLEAVDRFTAGTTAYPGRSFGQLYHRLVPGEQLLAGTVHLDAGDVRLVDVRVPVLVMAGADDAIVPVEAVRPLVSLLPGAREVRFEVVPGGHLGMLTGRTARSSTWRVLDEFVDAHAGPATPTIGANPRRRYSSAGSRSLRGAKAPVRGVG